MVSAKEKQAPQNAAFVFLAPPTKDPPATAGNGARQCGDPEWTQKQQTTTSEDTFHEPEIYILSEICLRIRRTGGSAGAGGMLFW